MHDHAQRGHVVAGLHFGREREQAVEHGRHQVGVGDAVALDQPQRLLRVPAVHEHHGDAAQERYGQREGQGGGVVQGAGAQVHVLARPVPVDGDGAGGGVGGLAAVDALACAIAVAILVAAHMAGAVREAAALAAGVERVGTLVPAAQALFGIASLGFDIGAKDLVPGQYECQVTVLDQATSKAGFWRASIAITP